MFSRLLTVLYLCLLASGIVQAQNCLPGKLTFLAPYTTLPVVQEFCSYWFPVPPRTTTTSTTVYATVTSSVSAGTITATATSLSTTTVLATVTTTVRAGGAANVKRDIPTAQISSFIVQNWDLVGKACTCFETPSTITATVTKTNTDTVVTTVPAVTITAAVVSVITVSSTSTVTTTYPAAPVCSPINPYNEGNGAGGCAPGCFCDRRGSAPDDNGSGVCDNLNGGSPIACSTDADCDIGTVCILYQPVGQAYCAPYADCLGGSSKMLFARYAPMRIESSKRATEGLPLRQNEPK